ncbi:CASP-like protein 1C3 [Gastrolobium bilobum]|uniref:CASP-like protein 1C3 n=1 Tax=Gastrolobium bilobum TaxID=150636 RepID=UPI002AB1890A|nr:CASP-like protein 1C3 [Gastrolobium bilobum]
MAKIRRFCHILLRFLAFGATLSAVIVMVTSHERTSFLTLSFEAKYTDSPAFKYFVVANSVVTVYGFFVLLLPEESLLWRLVVAMDLVFTMLLISSISAALAIAQVAKKGNTAAVWLPICDSVPKFCNQMLGALVAGFGAVIIYMILLLHSIHTVLDPLLLRKT